MATFKVGQRVRVIQSSRGLVGSEGVVMTIPGVFQDCTVLLDGPYCQSELSRLGEFDAPFEWLAPLVDPDPVEVRVECLEPA